VSRNAPSDEEVGQNVDHIDRLLAGDTDRQAFMGELVEHVEHPIPFRWCCAPAQLCAAARHKFHSKESRAANQAGMIRRDASPAPLLSSIFYRLRTKNIYRIYLAIYVATPI
jgi:hypothetical protein